MASMVVRNMSDELMRQVKETALREGKSAEQIAREAIADRVRPSREDILRRMEEIRAKSKPVDEETMLRIMRETRDERDARPFSTEQD